MNDLTLKRYEAHMTRRIFSLCIGNLAFFSVVCAEQTNAQTTYTLKPTPKTVAWGYYDAKAAVLRVKSGDTVEVQTPATTGSAQDEKKLIIYVKHLEPPSYPPIARQARLGGTIVLKLKIGPDGTVLSAESSPGDKNTSGFELLRKSAEGYVKRWTFGCVGCPPGVPFEHTIKFVYRLENEDILPDHYEVMDLPDVVIMYTGPVTLNTTNSKKGNN